MSAYECTAWRTSGGEWVDEVSQETFTADSNLLEWRPR